MSTIKTINVRCPKADREFTVDYEFGDNLAENVELFGEEAVNKAFVSASIISIQGVARGAAENPENTNEMIQERVSKFKPGVIQRSGKSKVEKAADSFTSLSEDEQAQVLALVEAAEKKKK